MDTPSTPRSLTGFILKGAAGGLLFMVLVVALLCQACGSERTVVAQRGQHNGYGLQKQRSTANNRRLNDYYNNKQHERYQNRQYYRP